MKPRALSPALVAWTIACTAQPDDGDGDGPASTVDTDTDTDRSTTDTARDTGSPDSGFLAPPTDPWAGPDTTSPAWATILGESGRCLAIGGTPEALDIVVVGIDSGTVHVVAPGLPLWPVHTRGLNAGLTWDGRWLWVTDGGVFRIDPLSGDTERVARRGVLANAVGFVDGDVVIVPPSDAARVDVYDDLSGLAAGAPSSSWPTGVGISGYQLAWGDDDAVWYAVPSQRLRRATLEGVVDSGPEIAGNEWLAGFAVAGGRAFRLDGGILPVSGNQRLHVHDAVTGEEVASYDLGRTDLSGLACVVDR